jgi:hypothetical protein
VLPGETGTAITMALCHIVGFTPFQSLSSREGKCNRGGEKAMVFDRFMVTSSKRYAMIKADGDIVHKGQYTSIGWVTMMY